MADDLGRAGALGAIRGAHVILYSTDAEEFVATMTARGLACSKLRREQWGVTTEVALPGGGAVGVYEPAYPSPRR